MIKKSISLIFIFFCFTAFSQTVMSTYLQSEVLKTKRDIKIFLPDGYKKDSIKNYPLAVVFDAEHLFNYYITNSKYYAAKDMAPKQIIVGISMDKTIKNDTYFNITNGKLNADNIAFYEFIRDELIYYMESNFRTSPFISLIGEGTSANLITHYLKEDKPFINSYICINPTFSDYVEQEFQSYNLNKFLNEDNTFYLYINNATSFSDKKQDKIGKLQKRLENVDLKNFNILNDTIKTLSNISVMSQALPRAMDKSFEIYSPISKEEFEKSIKHLSPLEAIAYLENKYLEIEFLFGSSLDIRKKDIYAVEKIVIEKENGDHLLEFGKMILKLFPTSPLGDYYIGRYYETGRQMKKALKQYKIGYGKMDPADPNANEFYENIIRINGQ